jgi:aspartate/methionine/tyrosine aminotransferase
MEILERAKELEREGKEIIHMEIGEPDLPPSPMVLEAIERHKDKAYGYTHSLGIPELREAVANYYWDTYRVEVSPERVIITTGTSGAFSLIFSALFDAGEGVVFTDPGYPCYKNFGAVYCLDTETLDVDASTGYQLTPEMLEEFGGFVKHFKGFLITSPSNPTGVVYDKENLKGLAEYAENQGLLFISDEIYHGLNYEKEVHTALEFSDEAIVVNGFSKYFCMPGFRLGWVIVPKRFVRQMQLVAQNLFISAPTLSQYAALAALSDRGYLEKVRETFRRRRDFFYSELKKLFEIEVEPQGAFYIWARIDRYSTDSFKFAHQLLEKAGVAVTPGVDFGKNNTERYVRFAYTNRLERLKEGVERIRRFLEENF